MKPAPSTWAAVAALALALLVLPLTGHRDDSDDQLYRVVARHLVEDGKWLDTRYLPNIHPLFREHLPFGLWPQAVALRWGGDRASWLPGLIFSLGTLAVVAVLGTRLAGSAAGLFAFLTLALTESLWSIGGTARLDPLLLFLSWVAVVPLFFERPGRAGWLLAITGGGLATLVKGPLGSFPWQLSAW